MLTTKDIQQSEKLTEEYGDGRDHGRQYPDPASVFEAMEVRHQRQSLEHSLATAFITMQRERRPLERQGLWLECQRLAAEIERLNAQV